MLHGPADVNLRRRCAGLGDLCVNRSSATRLCWSKGRRTATGITVVSRRHVDGVQVTIRRGTPRQFDLCTVGDLLDHGVVEALGAGQRPYAINLTRLAETFISSCRKKGMFDLVGRGHDRRAGHQLISACAPRRSSTRRCSSRGPASALPRARVSSRRAARDHGPVNQVQISVSELLHPCEINQCVGCTRKFFIKSFSAMTRPCRLRRAVTNRHRHAIEQASRRWRGGRRDGSARTP